MRNAPLVELEASDEWKVFEFRGFYQNADAIRPGALKIQFNFGPSSCGHLGELEGWIDDVVLTRVAGTEALDYAGFRAPAQYAVIPAGSAVPIQVFPDQRVSAANPLVGMAGDAALGTAQRWMRFQWYNPTTSAWVAIPQSEFGSTELANQNYRDARVYFWYRPAGWTYSGSTKLRVQYFAHSVPEPEEDALAEIEGPWFVLAPPPPVMVAEEPEDTHLFLTGTHPYGLLNFNFDGGTKTDVLVTVASAEEGYSDATRVFQNVSQFGAHLAVFQELPEDVFLTPVPRAARSAAAGVIQAGDSLSVAICTPAAGQRTLVYTVDAGTLDTLSTHQIPGPAALNVWAAAFGSYDLDDDLDLYLVRAQDFQLGEDGPSPVEMDGKGLPDALLEWTAAGYVNRTAQALPYSGNSETIGASWVDVNSDRHPDLLVAHLGPLDNAASPGWSPLYINQGDGTFVDAALPDLDDPLSPEVKPGRFGFAGVGGGGGVPAPPPKIPRLGSVSAMQWMDVDGDGDVELAVAAQNPTSSSKYNIALIGNSGYGELLQRAANGIEWLQPVQSLGLMDLDGNGVADIVGTPASGSDQTVPVLLGYSVGPGEVTYAPAASSAGIAPGVGGAVVADDYDQDGDVDVLLARRLAANGTDRHYYYSNDENPSGGAGIVRVSLRANGSGNAELGEGATIEVHFTKDGQPAMISRLVDGGGGRQAAAGVPIVLGVDPDPNTTIRVHGIWPDGSENWVYNVAPGATVQIADTHYALISSGSVQGTYSPGEGWTVWTFAWDTQGSASWHEIVLQLNSGGAPCALPPGFLLTPQSEGASLTSTYNKQTGKFHHVLTWSRECVAPCTYKYTVRSYSATRMHTVPQKTLYVPVCGNIEG